MRCEERPAKLFEGLILERNFQQETRLPSVTFTVLLSPVQPRVWDPPSWIVGLAPS